MEIIVIDNGSYDGSGTLDTEFPNTKFLRLPRNFGATKALNIAMRTALGEYMFFLSPEIEVAPDAATKLAAAIDADPDAMAACPAEADVWRLPDTATLNRLWRDPDALKRMPIATDAEAIPVDYAGRRGLMARKFFVRGLNYIDERYGEFGGDLEIAYQIRRSGKKTLLIPAAHVTRHPAPAAPKSAANILAADRAAGVVAFLSKHAGFGAGMMFQIGAALKALLSLEFGVLAGIASGSKIDGSQSGI